MKINEAYNIWAEQYDTNKNRTRDLEAIAIRELLNDLTIDSCLEIGCGTGKNTVWLADKAATVMAVDFSTEMLAKAKEKVALPKVSFVQADITEPWEFAGDSQFSMVTFSLVLEHIEDIAGVFKKLVNVVAPGGYVYIGELHPFKQYAGTAARFDTENGREVLTCFNHNVSDFTGCAVDAGFEIARLEEYFDEGDRSTTPRILALLLRKR